ncbi:L,D-transpeptidase family protein [Caldisalinibacter kiritimatiensis]|uniref:Cell surface protein, ErfK family n=1 Tax=Caldisalinibacter kiritimatiensis TaxID=1304284 RepID=R1CYP3_9FIRM|nr:L,D-transpeptidase family protein [Caldisalinibacter kiritimatiensis]EOD01704.1 cell surface protein, ErfK family [Caldisalinibacter kiritimatiensis]
MKIRLFILLMCMTLLLVGCENEGFQKPNVEETINVVEDDKEASKELNDTANTENDGKNEENKDKEEAKKYIGQALDTLEWDKVVEVYKEKSKKSEVIYKMKDLEEIELIETVPYGWFKVRLEDGTEGYVDARYVRTKEVPPHEYNENIEGYALVFTHQDQTLRIYKDGQLVKESIGSSGLWDHFTPRGIFQIEKGRRGKWAYIPRFNQGFKYWVGFKGVYLFHSVPYDKNGQVIQEEAEKLGQPASHGCIRLPVDVAKFIYENVPEGSLVLIY